MSHFGSCILFLLFSIFVCSSSSLSGLSPIVFIPGDGGNQLEARLAKPEDSSGCPTVTSSWYRLWLDVWQLTKGKLGCWAENIKLVYNKTSRTSSNVEGVFTRVPGWGDTSSMEYLDPSWSAWVLGDAGNYLHDMVEFLVSKGYTRGLDLRGAPFDFRFAPQSQDQYFRKLKQLIEDLYHDNNDRPVTIITHSMGGLFGLHFLQQQPRAWLDKFIHSFIPVSTPWAGAALQMLTYASGYNMDISLIDPLVIREEQRSYETGVYILPLPTTWPDSKQVLVTTPARNYTVQDYALFFDNIGFPDGWDMMKNILNLTPLKHPRVRTSCVYSVGVKTPARFVYKDGFPDSQPERVLGDGDGTVTKESAEICKKFLTGPGDSVMVYQGPDHGGILRHKPLFSHIASQIILN